ncbi:MAG: hypothetical protein WC608_00450 [Parcubacteria group bacterium]
MEDEIRISGLDSGGKKKTVLIISIVVLVLILAGAGFFVWKNYSQKQSQFESLQKQIEDLKNQAQAPADQNATPEENSVEAADTPETDSTGDYVGWKIYNNYAVGYQLKYPADWTIKETNAYSDLMEKDVKYVTLYNPNKKYFLHWGLKYKGDEFAATDRTGLGAGDFVNTGTKITILGTAVDVVKQVYKSETQEMFFPAAGETKTTDGKYSFVNSFTYNTTHRSSDPDLSGIPEEKLAEKILASVVIIPRTASVGCASTLTSADKLNMKDWKTFKNDKYDYSFEYPKEWTYDKVSDKLINFKNGSDGEVFSWRSEEMTAMGFEGWEVDSAEKNLKIACQSAKSTYLKQGVERMIFTQFKKGGLDHMTNFGYKYFGASISSDLVEEYDLILKSVAFE